MTLSDQLGTVEYRAEITDPETHGSRTRFLVRRRTIQELRDSVDAYRGFGYEVAVQQRECGPWVDSAALDEEQRDG